MKTGKIKKSGFTLIEILVVIGIIAILAAIVIIAINPARQFAQARNSQRVSNVNALLNSVGQSLADNKGVLTGCLSGISLVDPVPSPLTSAVGKKITSVAGVGNVDISCVTPTYIPTLPVDPSATGAQWTSVADYDTAYYIFKDVNGRITVFAPTLEPTIGNAVISVTR